MTIFLTPLSSDDQNFEGFFDGSQKLIPDNTILNVEVIDGFNGQQDSMLECFLKVRVVSQGAFFGQSYKKNFKIYDIDSSKRDLAMRNLGVVDRAAGYPLTKQRIALDKDSIQSYWVGKSIVRAKFGVVVNDRTGEEMNFIRGFAHVTPSQQQNQDNQQGNQNQAIQQQQQTQYTQQPQPQQIQHSQQPQSEDIDDIGF